MEKSIASISRSAEILKCLSDGINRISDISQKLKMGKSTVHRLLKALESAKLVIQDPVTHHYYLGSLIINLASKPLIAHQNLNVCALESLTYLREFTRETVILHIRIGVERICLEELQSLENIKFSAGKGYVAPIYTGSAGKVLLSEISEIELQQLLENINLKAIAPNTITNKDELLKEIKKAKKQGYAMSFGERVSKSSSVSVPIKEYICPVAMSILGPDNRFTLERMKAALVEMKKEAKRISEKLIKTNSYALGCDGQNSNR